MSNSPLCYSKETQALFREAAQRYGRVDNFMKLLADLLYEVSNNFNKVNTSECYEFGGFLQNNIVNDKVKLNEYSKKKFIKARMKNNPFILCLEVIYKNSARVSYKPFTVHMDNCGKFNCIFGVTDGQNRSS